MERMKKWSATVTWQTAGGQYPCTYSMTAVAQIPAGAVEECRRAFPFPVAVSDLALSCEIPQ